VPSRSPAPARAKERLSRETVARAALALTDGEGLDALTVRRLATDLGVTPMALYWHFKDKDALLEGVAEAVLLEVRLPTHTESEPWAPRLRELLDALLAPLAAHPAAAPLVKTRMLLNDAGRDIAERVLDLLAEAGFSAERAAQVAVYAMLSMTSLVSDVPGQNVGASEEERDQEVRAKWAALQALPPKRYPRLLESAGWLTDCVESDDWLARGMDTLMAGIEGEAGRVRT
jgi:TetR/AcrR family transcriptional regulator, tetracycline repressor protein